MRNIIISEFTALEIEFSFAYDFFISHKSNWQTEPKRVGLISCNLQFDTYMGGFKICDLQNDFLRPFQDFQKCQDFTSEYTIKTQITVFSQYLTPKRLCQSFRSYMYHL